MIPPIGLDFDPDDVGARGQHRAANHGLQVVDVRRVDVLASFRGLWAPENLFEDDNPVGRFV